MAVPCLVHLSKVVAETVGFNAQHIVTSTCFVLELLTGSFTCQLQTAAWFIQCTNVCQLNSRSSQKALQLMSLCYRISLLAIV